MNFFSSLLWHDMRWCFISCRRRRKKLPQKWLNYLKRLHGMEEKVIAVNFHHKIGKKTLLSFHLYIVYIVRFFFFFSSFTSHFSHFTISCSLSSNEYSSKLKQYFLLLLKHWSLYMCVICYRFLRVCILMLKWFENWNTRFCECAKRYRAKISSEKDVWSNIQYNILHMHEFDGKICIYCIKCVCVRLHSLVHTHTCA